MLSTIPFSGFYGSVHSDQIDYTIENMLSDSSGCHPIAGLVERFWSEGNFTGVHEQYAATYAAALAGYVKVKWEFESLSSPREYNFTTDVIFVTIDEAEVLRLRAETSEHELRNLARERFTSRSGFSSFYSNDIDEWGPIEEWDHNQVGTLVGAYVNEQYGDRSDGFDQWAEMELVQDLNCNGDLDNWICEASPVNLRLANIAGYLRQREERAFR